MLSDNGKISDRQAAWILIMDMIAVGLFGLSDILAAGNVIVLLSGGFVWLLIWSCIDYFIFLFQKYVQSSIVIIFKWIWVALCIVIIVKSLDYFYNIIDTLVPIHYGKPVLLLLIPAIYGAVKGVEARGRLAELLGWIIITPLVILFVMGIWQVVSDGNFQGLWQGTGEFEIYSRKDGVTTIAWLFLGIDNPWLMRSYIEERPDSSATRKKKINGVLLGWVVGSLVNLIALLMVGLYLHLEGMERDRHPFGIVLQLIRLPINFISRYDIFYIALWMVCFSIFLSGVMIRVMQITGIKQRIETIMRMINMKVGKNRKK